MNKRKIIIIAIISIAVSIFWLRFANDKTYQKRSRFLLGTIIEITACDSAAFDIAFNEISRVEKIFSKFDPQSQVSKLNSSGILDATDEIINLIQKSKDFAASTEGAFDITVAPVVDIWKKAIKTKTLPDEEKVINAKSLIGIQDVLINSNTKQIKFAKQGMAIDLGGIAKGYAVDCAIGKLKERGITSCLINAGGDMYCLGKKGRQPWRIGVQDPRNPNKLVKELELINKAVATSGDYEQYFSLDNTRFSHIINPKTGMPAQSGATSVTVIADDCITADAFATAIFVLGKEKGLNLLRKLKGVEAYIYTEKDLDVQDN